MRVFCHHIYEYKKGLRNLILHTMASKDVDLAIKKLESNGIDYLIQPVSVNKVNIYFGAKECVDVINCFCHKSLNELSPEEDYILGTLLGYNQVVQCARYLKKKEASPAIRNAS
ncbi:DUF2023 family protein [Carboxylicivirga linearis]|uniref:DUF2023 family protein n=1 Tax=Carboxylicivirga linearis TaxID=1628157 RepID=A0ABS5K047_9BACT|nr:DUF2023 family protein [Carboxylicivirga linearis]MBS2100445.1 DUF2023 family protein [Carboxylicivirga linearis]